MRLKNVVMWLVIFSSFIIGQNRDSIVLNSGLLLKTSDMMRRNMFTADPVEEGIVKGIWKAPAEGDSLVTGKNTAKWTRITADKDGWFDGENLRGGYIYIVYYSPVKQKAILEGFGHSLVYVNGELHYGNRYGSKEKYADWEPRFDISRIPIELKEGKNEFLFSVSGKMKAKLLPIEDGIYFNLNDATLPDMIAGEQYEGYGAVALINATDKPLENISIATVNELGDKKAQSIKCRIIQPMSIQKIPVKIFHPKPGEKGSAGMKLRIFENDSRKIIAETTIKINIVNKTDNHKVTFISGIDGSVQYYSINPARNDDGKPKALFLSIHGAGVEAVNQSNSYYPKTWGHIVAATNRRPYGFNWEDWGRIDALEVYNNAVKTLNIDPERIYLTGHSMGGHGAWHLGALYPDKFAAIGPSAGWISLWSYRFREKNDNPSPMENIIMRASSPSDTYSLSENYKQEGIYIIHGEKDDSVPPTESRNMVEKLKKFHNDFVYYEQPGAGHWWDNSDEEGADCVDWAPLFDFFARHSLPKDEMVREISFVTSNPEVSSKDHWLTIIAQNEQFKPSKANFRFDPGKNRFTGKTENIYQMALLKTSADLKKTISIEIDGQKMNVEPESIEADMIILQKENGTWIKADKLNKEHKNYFRYGSLKSMINHNVVFIYGTKGSAEENEWAFNKARFDAEQFWYQGNGSITVISDDYYSVNMAECNYVLYGNAETNSAWNKLLSGSPVQVTSGKVKIGEKEYKGTDIACLFVRPIKGALDKVVGVVAGTGITGMKLNDRRSYMLSGYSFPDVTLYNSESMTKGFEGVLAAGFFGLDWSVDKGEIIYKTDK